MNFAESVGYLLSLGNEVSTMKLGLENISKLLNALKNPQKNYLKVQVAGTNGKGSVCAFLDSICGRACIKTGLYTSPHLISITERIKIDGLELSESDFVRQATFVRETAESLYARGEIESIPTFFEQVTAIALLAFADAKVDLAIIETGLGGRLDATTAANAEIAAITQIDFDHQEYLGETLAEIAAEKAAIIRANSRVIVIPQAKEAERAIIGRCREVGVEPIWVKTKVKLTPRENDYSEGAVFNTGEITITSPHAVYSRIALGLWGKHQWVNAAAAIEIAELLPKFGFQITNSHIRDGLTTARHPGRLEFVGRFLLDGAHNAAAAIALAKYIDEFIKQPITLIFGSMQDKDVGEITRTLFPRAETVILTKAENSRAMEPAELREYIPDELDKENIILTESVEEALTIAPSHSFHSLILVTGSLYLVGEAKKILQNDSET